MSTATQRAAEARRIAAGSHRSCADDLLVYGQRASRIYVVRGFGVYVFPTAGTLTRADLVKQIADEIETIERYGEPLNPAPLAADGRK